MQYIKLFIPLLLFYIFYFSPIIENQHFYGNIDIATLHFPSRAIYETSVRNGEFPLWTKQMFCGYRLYAQGEIGAAHPFHMLLHSSLKLGYAFIFELCFIYAFSYASIIILLHSFKLPDHLKMLGATLFTFSPFMIGHYIHINMIFVWAHLPLIIWTNNQFLSSTKYSGIKYLLITSLLIASQLLLGHPQAFLLSAWVWIPLTLYGCYYYKKLNIKTFWLGFGSICLGIGIAAIQLIPTWDLLNEATRTIKGNDFVNNFSSPFINFIQLLFPFIFSNMSVMGEINTPAHHEFLFYIPSVLIVAFFVVYKQKTKLPKSFISFIYLNIIFFGLLTLGKHGYINSLFNYVPILQELRVPVRYFSAFYFYLGFLFILFLNSTKYKVASIQLARYTKLFITFGSIIFIYFLISHHFTSESHLVLLSYIMFFLLLIPFTKKKNLSTLTKKQVSYLVIAASFIYLSISFEKLYLKDPINFYNETEVSYNKVNLYRVIASPSLTWLPAKGYLNAEGYMQLTPEPTKVIGIEEMKKLSVEILAESGTSESVPNPVPRFVIYEGVNSIDNYDYRAPYITANIDARFTVTDDKNLEQSMEANLQKPSLLVISDRWHKYWHVTVNGKKRPIIQLSPRQRAVLLPEGKSKIHFYYTSSAFNIGKNISVVSLIIFLLLIIILFFRKKEASTASSLSA